jgi:hypothetical protein
MKTERPLTWENARLAAGGVPDEAVVVSNLLAKVASPAGLAPIARSGAVVLGPEPHRTTLSDGSRSRRVTRDMNR